MSTKIKTGLSLNDKLFNLQQKIGTISKDAKNPFYKSKYFDINSLISQLQPLFEKNRLLLLQPIIEDVVYSKIKCIDSGESEISGLKLPPITDPQKLGGAITYYRRYTLASLLGLQAVDDDGNTASGITKAPTSKVKINKTPIANVVLKNEEKPWLNPNTPEYAQAIAHLKGGGGMEAIESKYRMSTQNRNELSGL